MSGKRRRSDTSWEMKHDKMPPPDIDRWHHKDLNSNTRPPKSNPSWDRNRNMPKNDDISRHRHNMHTHQPFDHQWEKQYSDHTYHLQYRDRSRSRGRDREFTRTRSRSPHYDDRYNSNEYNERNNSRLSFRPFKENWSQKPNYSSGYHYDDDYDGKDDRRKSYQISEISKIQCKFFAVGKCYRDDCKFSHDIQDSQDYDRRSNDNTRAHKNMTWHDGRQSEKKKSWDDVDSRGFDENKKTTWDLHVSGDKKKSTWGDVSNPNLDNKNKSWDNAGKSNVRDETSLIDNKMRTLDNEKGSEKNDDLLQKQNDVVNDSDIIINNENKVSEEQVENGKSPKKKQDLAENEEKEQENINSEKAEKGNIGNDEKSIRKRTERDENRSRSPFYDDRHKSNEYGNQVRNNSRNDNLKESWNHRQDYSKSSYSKNSRNHYDHYDHYDDGKDDRCHSNRTSKIPCKFFAVGNCNRDDCKFSHDLSDTRKYDRRSYDDTQAHKNMTWHDGRQSHASDLNEKNKWWSGPTWGGDVASNKKRTWDSQSFDDKKKSTRDDVSNPNFDYKNRSWDRDELDASRGTHGAKSGNNIYDEKGYEKNDDFLPQEHNMVNDSRLKNDNVVSEEGNRQIPKKGNIGNDVMENENWKNPKKKWEKDGSENRVVENAKEEQEKSDYENFEKGNIGNDEKCMRHFRAALVEFVKEILKPKWKEGRMTREVYKTVVKKVIDKITSTIQEVQIPRTEAKIEVYLTQSKSKIMKLVDAYVDKLVKAY